MRICRTSPRAESSCRIRTACRATAGGCTARAGRLGDESGVVLVVIILLIALMLSLGAAGTRTAQIELRIASNDVMSKQALEVAEAGWNHAYGLIQRENALTQLNEAANGFSDELSAGGTGGALAGLGSLRTLSDGNSYRFAQTSDQTGTDDGYYVRIVDNQDETAGMNDPTIDVDNQIHIVSRGRVGTAERVIETIVERDPTAQCVLCGNRAFPLPLVNIIDLAMVGQVTTDSYDSREGPYDPLTAGNNGHVIGNGAISLVGGPVGLLPVTVKGNVRASSNVVSLLTVNVTGSVTQNAPQTYFPPVAPCGPPYPPNTGVTGQFIYNRATGTLIDVGINATIDFAPGEYCFSSIMMLGIGSRIRVSGPTRISLTGPLPSTIAGIVNTTGKAADLRIESSIESPLPVPPGIFPALTLAGVAGDVSMVVNAPQAIVTFAAVATNLTGQIVAGYLPTLPLGRLTYDTALDSPRLYRRGWRELRDYPPA